MIKKFIKYRYGLLLGLMFITVSCLNTDDCNEECFTPPAPFTLIIEDKNGNNLIRDDVYPPDSISLFYIKNNNQVDVKTYFNEVQDGFIIYSNELPWEMMETNNPTFFIYLTISDTDTLNIEVVRKSDGCCTWHSYEKYQYNGVDMEIDMEYYAFVGVK